MARRLDHILIVDVESTCWEQSPPPGEESEIIEIGLCLFDVQSRERSGKRSILVKPQRSRVSQFCEALTTLTQAVVDDGILFDEACKLLRTEYDSKNRAWASFGDYDRRMFERQCTAFGVAYPFGASHLNVKTWFALKHQLPREMGMAQALEMLSLPLEGTHHRGHDDAWNIAAVLSHLLMS